jgi:hypothetical protein
LEEFLRRKLRAESRLQHVNRQLASWDAWDELQALPPEERGTMTRPPLSREILLGRQQLLLERTRELEELWERRN